MQKEENNLFKFATKELSQDAFICWCINCINYQSTFEIGKKMLIKFIPNELLQDLNFDSIRVDIKKQFLNMDILLIINKKYFIIIEDKIDTSEHSYGKTNITQLKLYKEKLVKSLKKAETKSKLEIEDFEEKNIYTVYLKTGNMNDVDAKVKSDLKLTGSDILKVILECLDIEELDCKAKMLLREFFVYLNEKLNLYNDARSKDFMNKGEMQIGTRYLKKYQCLNCFAKYLTFSKTEMKEYTKDYQYTFRGTRTLDKIKSKRICVWFPRYYNYDGWINKFEDDGNFIEEYKIRNGNKENVKFEDEKDKYRYVFARKNDMYNNEIFEFMGLYYIDNKTSNDYKRVWKRYNSISKMVSLDAERMERELEKSEIKT